MDVDSADREMMESMRPTAGMVTVFGGSGFLGRHIVHALARRGYRVRVAVRRPNDAHYLRPMGVVGQVEPVQANIRDEASVRMAVRGAVAVVNLVGLLHESGKQTFDAVMAEGAGRVARACSEAGVKKLVHVSAIGADEKSPSDYGRAKAAGEKAVRQAFPAAVIVRPSIVFGPEDDFFNRFGAMARFSPMLPLIGGGSMKLQPVYVKDVAEGVARLVERDGTERKTYEFGGPEVKTFRGLMEDLLVNIARKRILLPVPAFAAKFMAFFTQFIPNPPLTPDQVRLLAIDSVVSEAAESEGRTLGGLGVQPTALEIVLPTYLYRFRRSGQFERINAS